MLAAGCGGKAAQSAETFDERQRAALRDPFGYKIDDRNDVSGGDIDALDRKSMKKDFDHVLNP